MDTQNRREIIQQMFRAGKTTPQIAEALSEEMPLVPYGDTFRRSFQLKHLLDAPNHRKLPHSPKLPTPRERQTLELLQRGRTTAEMAEAFGTSAAAVHNYCMGLRKKGFTIASLRDKAPTGDPLSPQQRMIHTLRTQGLSHKLIASLLNIGMQVSINTAHHARKRLLCQMEKDSL